MNNDWSLAGQVALITGAASGIGLAIARRIAVLGAVVVGVDVDGLGLSAVADEFAEQDLTLGPLVCDLSDAEQVRAVVPEVVHRHGNVDILVNAAGIDVRDTFMEAELESFELVHRIDLVAPFLLMQACGLQMVKQGRGGKIVNISSSSAFRAVGAPPGYAAAKSGLVALTRSAAATFGPHNVNVNVVAPGMTDTPMLRASVGDDDEFLQGQIEKGPASNLLRRISRPEDVANVVAFLCMNASRQITAQVVHTSAGAVI